MAKDSLTITDNRTGKTYEIPIEHGTIRALDLRQIKTAADDFGLMTYDPAFTNTAACKSRITFIDGDKGILNYRGYPIEQLAEKSNYLETAYLILHGELPTTAQYEAWVYNITHHTMVHENIKELMAASATTPIPWACSCSTVAALSTFYPEAKDIHDPRVRRRPDLPAHRQDAHPGRLRLPPLGGDALRLPRQRPLLLRQLPADDVQDGRGPTR